MFKLRLKSVLYPNWIEFNSTSQFYDFLDNKYTQSLNEEWQWYDDLTGEWKHFSEHYIRGNKKKLWFV